ncbi:TPA: Arm DNA-binding domain-containing protein [Escherichia coli]
MRFGYIALGTPPIQSLDIRKMPKLTDMQIRAWIKSGERFEGRADGNGLYLRYREADKTPTWRFRYKLAGKSRAMLIGSYSELSLSKARETAKELSARVALGYDVAAEKQERKAEALAKMEAEKNAMRVSDLASEYFERQILPRWKHPDILRRRIDKDINPCIGHMKVIDDVAGAPDALAMSEKYIYQINSRMEALKNRSDQLYKRVDSALSPRTKVEANNTSTMLEKIADDLGGWDNLDPIEKRVFTAINPGPDSILTYANLNRQRRLVGDALNKKQGPYKDADKEALSRLYGALAEDQKSVLSNTGYLRDFEVAQRLVAMRKNLERQMVNLRGKTLNGDIAYKVTNSLQSMAKGDARGFREIMQNTPSRTLRRELVGTALRDMLSSGKRGADFNPSGFADWWQNLQHSGQLKTLAEHLPKETMSGLYDVYKVARAIKNAKAHEISTGKLNEFVNRFNRVTAPYELAAKHIQKIGTMVGAHFGSLGAIAGADIGARLASKARLAGGAGAADAADKLIASPAFQSAVKNLHGKAPGHIVDSRIRRSPQWKSFFNSLPEQEKRTIARLGIITWLSNDPDND